jgi:hypothetical protein
MPSASSARHVFHTKHDFAPDLGWAAFGLLSQVDGEVSVEELEELATTIASPLVVRSDLHKLMGAMQDVGLVTRGRHGVELSPAGRVLALSAGEYEDGFRKAVHCLYVWRWEWEGARDETQQREATPAWSYREVCRQLLAAGAAGLDRNDLVLRVVEAARCFEAEKVSFSTSSVAGVTMWLDAQRPPLARREGSRIVPSLAAPTPGTLRLHMAALCRVHQGEAALNLEALSLLADALLLPSEELTPLISEFCRASEEFLLIPSATPRLILRPTHDPFLRWVSTGQANHDNANTTAAPI